MFPSLTVSPADLLLQSCRGPRFAAPEPEGEDRGEDEGPAGAGAQCQQGTVNGNPNCILI